jgi:hypothetical protein
VDVVRDRGKVVLRKHVIRAFSAGLAALAMPAALSGQQFGTDDASIVGFRACQLEAWHGETETRVEPACQPIRNLEIMVGFGLLPNDTGRSRQILMETKYAVVDSDDSGIGLAFAAGVEIEPPEHTAANVAALYALVPVSVDLASDRLTLHANLGLRYERDQHEHEGEVHDARHLLSLWAARGDLLLPGLGERLTLVSELYGTGRDSPAFQVGMRASLLPDTLVVDLSWGGHMAAGERGAGWVIGLGWTPPRLF